MANQGSNSLELRKCKLKPQRETDSIPTALAKIKKYDNNKWGRKRTGPSYTVGRSVKILLWKTVLHCFVKLKDLCPLPQQIPSCNLKQWFSKCGPLFWLVVSSITWELVRNINSRILPQFH